jgi:transcriptional antiterminator RfaH
MHDYLDGMEDLSFRSTTVGPPRGSLGAWFCLRSHPKREHIAAAQLRQNPAIEVFLPRIRYKRSTRFGPVWTTEALFQNYLFARFDPESYLRRVRNAHSVRGVVHFGDRYPTIPASVIEDLRSASGPNEMCIVGDSFNSGDLVQISGGPFHGLEAVVTRAMPGQQRVALLLDFLGRQTTVELDGACLVAA